MTKKDYELIADLTATLALSGVPVVEVLLNKELNAQDVMNIAQVRATAYIACKKLNSPKFDWVKFKESVNKYAEQYILKRRQSAD